MSRYSENYGSVFQFHSTFDFPRELETLEDGACFDGDQALDVIEGPLHVIEHSIRRAANDDVRVARVHLIVEETRELVNALRKKDEIEVADALADLLYVVVGSFVTWGYPDKSLFDEVHRSNMTKTVDGAHKPGKGANYSPPDIEGALNS